MTTPSPGPTQSAGRWLADINRQLGGESPLVGGPRFAAGDIGRQVRVFVQNTRWFQPEQHRYHHQVAGAEATIEPLGAAKARRELLQAVVDAILNQRQAFPAPGLIGLENPGDCEL